MKWPLLFITQTLVAGCGHSQPQNPPVQPTQIYVQPITPIHQSLVRTRASSVSISDSEGETETRRIRTAIVIMRRQSHEEKKDIPDNGPKTHRLRRTRSSQPGAPLD
jgi:hypothetical protein